MKKVFTALFAAMAVMFVFSSCVIEDASDDIKFTYTYNVDELHKDYIGFMFKEINSDSCAFAGEVKYGLKYYLSSKDNVFDESLAVLKFNLGFMPESQAVHEEQWENVKIDWNESTTFKVDKYDAEDIKELCKKSATKEILLFLPKDSEHYKVLYFAMNKK